ncbi:MAG: S1C family serine protease [Oscillospiraceae bacterium]
MYDSDNYTYSNGGFIPGDPEQKPPKKSGAGKIIAAVLAVIIVGGASGYGGAYLANMNNQSAISEEVSANAESVPKETEKTEATVKEENTSSAAANSGDKLSAEALVRPSSSGTALTTAEVIEKATPSVVFITSEFENSGSMSTGTGIVFTSDGYIITNAHVITAEVSINNNNYNYSRDPFSSFFDNFYNYNYSSGSTEVRKADKVTVTTSDEQEYTAEVVGFDANTDLAVLKIDASGLTAAEIGSSTDIAMGDKAITLGYPLGLGLSASDGIISGLDKEMTVEVTGGTATMTLIQTDAAINFGNSGGPLLNDRGQVIGITSSKLVNSSVDGVGFAIPITDALPIIDELRSTGTVKSTVPKIGITGTPITSAVKRYYNLPVDSGVLVASVEPDSCAAAAGISEGDIIVAADGEEVKDMDTLVKLKNKHKAGEKMTLTLARSDGNVDVELTLDAE